MWSKFSQTWTSGYFGNSSNLIFCFQKSKYILFERADGCLTLSYLRVKIFCLCWSNIHNCKQTHTHTNTQVLNRILFQFKTGRLDPKEKATAGQQTGIVEKEEGAEKMWKVHIKGRRCLWSSHLSFQKRHASPNCSPSPPSESAQWSKRGDSQCARWSIFFPLSIFCQVIYFFSSIYFLSGDLFFALSIFGQVSM